VKQPRILFIAGLNGADKTTFAREFLPKEAQCPMNTKDISEASDPLLPASVAAMKRAAERARRQALMTRTRLVVWRDKRIRPIDPAMPDPGASDASSNAEVSVPVDRSSGSDSP